MKTFLIGATTLLLTAGALATCSYIIQTPEPQVWTSRFRMTIEIDTPHGVRSGSSVYEQTATTQEFSPLWLWFNGGGFKGTRPEYSGPIIRITGEAAVIELESKDGVQQYLLATLRTGDFGEDRDFYALAQQTFQHILPTQRARGSTLAGLQALPIGTKAEFRGRFPTMITISDLRDPAAVRFAFPPDFEELGPGYKLRRAWLERTSDDLSRGIESRIPFLTTHRKELNARYKLSSGKQIGTEMFVRNNQ